MEKRITSVETLPPVLAALFFIALSFAPAHITCARVGVRSVAGSVMRAPPKIVK